MQWHPISLWAHHLSFHGGYTEHNMLLPLDLSLCMSQSFCLSKPLHLSSRSQPSEPPLQLCLFCGCAQVSGELVVRCLQKVSSASLSKDRLGHKGHSTPHHVYNVLCLIKPISARPHNPNKRSSLASCGLPAALKKYFKRGRSIHNSLQDDRMPALEEWECVIHQLHHTEATSICTEIISPFPLSFHCLVTKELLPCLINNGAEIVYTVTHHSLLCLNKWKMLLHFELVSSFNSAFASLFFMDVQYQYFVLHLSSSGCNQQLRKCVLHILYPLVLSKSLNHSFPTL